MLNSVNLLPLDKVKGKNTKKATKNRELYQLKKVDEERFTLSPFTMLTFTGNFNYYLEENGITLCYLVEESDVLLKDAFGIYIKTYDTDESGFLKLHQDKVMSKKHTKGI